MIIIWKRITNHPWHIKPNFCTESQDKSEDDDSIPDSFDKSKDDDSIPDSFGSSDNQDNNSTER